MIRFVIVDDDEKSITRIKRVIDRIKFSVKCEVKTYVFKGFNQTLEELIKNCEEKTIYILDIELENSKSGIEIASMIREYDWNSKIIFATNHDKMFETAHRNVYEVFDFIEKYYELEKRLSRDLKVIINKLVDRNIFVYKGRKVDLHLYLNTIDYIYRDKKDRKLIIVTNTKSFSVNLSLKEILNLLDSRFKMVHRSCIVNTDKVSIYDWVNSTITLTNGKEVNYLSKNYKKEVI